MISPHSFESIYNISPYIGGDITPPGFTRRIVLASNENPYGPSPLVHEAISKYTNIQSYPSGAATSLREALASFYHIEPSWIVTGNGSEDMLHNLARAFAREGDEIIIPEHGFGVYKIATLAVGATPVIAKRNSFILSVDSILEKITNKTKIIFLDHPGNPVAHYLNNLEVEELLKKVPKNVLVVFDSAYAEYMNKKSDYHSGIEWVKKHPNVVMVRTFSKAFGMANLRLGWLYGQENIVDPINRIRPPFNTTGISQIAGIQALKDFKWVEECVEKNEQNLNLFKIGLEALKVSFLPFESNFVMAHFNNAYDVYQYLGKKGVVVRPMNAYNLPNYLRITISLKEHMEECLTVLKECLSQ